MLDKFMRKGVNILKKFEFFLQNLDCANCANKIQNKIAQNKEFQNVIVNFNTLKLSYEAENENRDKIIAIVKSLEPDVEVKEVHTKNEKETNQLSFQIIRLVLGIGIAGIGFLAGIEAKLANLFIILAYFILLYRTIGNAIQLLKTSKSINENFLVTISCFGAYFIGEPMEGLMVIILYEVGKILEDKAVHKTRKSISDLMDIKPDYANLKTETGSKEITPEEVKIRRYFSNKTRRKNSIRWYCCSRGS